MLPNFIKKRSVQLPLCQDEIQQAKVWLCNHRYTSPDHYFIDRVEALLKAPSAGITLSQIADMIYEYLIDCVQNETCDVDSILNLTETRFSQLEAFAQDDCTKKMLHDRLADITGRLFIFTFNDAAKNLANKKTSRLPVIADPCLSLLATTSNTFDLTSVDGYAGSARVTEHASLTVSQDSWLVKQTNGSDWVEGAPLFNLTQSNTTESANSTAIDTYQTDFQPNSAAYVGASIHGLAGGTLAIFSERLGDYFAAQYPAQRSTWIYLAKGLYLMGMASFPLLYASLESSFLQLDALQTTEGLKNSLFTFISSILLQLVVEKAQQNGLNQSQIRRLMGHLIPLLACGWVLQSAEKPVHALIAWALNLGAHMLSYAAWTHCLPARSSVCAANSPQENEAPASLQSVATVNADNANFSRIGTFHERSLQNAQRMTEPVIPECVLSLEINEEKSVPVPEPIYSEINESTSDKSAMAKENSVTQSTLKIKEDVSEAGYIDMRASQKRKPIPLSNSLLYAVPKKQPQPVLTEMNEQSEKSVYVCNV